MALTLQTTRKACGISPACYRTACWISASFEQSGKEDKELQKWKSRKISWCLQCEKNDQNVLIFRSDPYVVQVEIEGASFLASCYKVCRIHLD